MEKRCQSLGKTHICILGGASEAREGDGEGAGVL